MGLGIKKLKNVKDFKRIKSFLVAMDYYGIDEQDLENIKLIPTIIENEKVIIEYLTLLKGNMAKSDQDNFNQLINEKIEGLKTNE